MDSGGDLRESESVKLYSSGNWGVKKWPGPRETGIFRVPHGIPISPEEFFLKCKFVQCTQVEDDGIVQNSQSGGKNSALYVIAQMMGKVSRNSQSRYIYHDSKLLAPVACLPNCLKLVYGLFLQRAKICTVHYISAKERNLMYQS